MCERAALPTPEQDKIQAFEGLRAPLAWWVVLGHVAQSFGLVVPLLSQNRIPVDVFIILSGYVIYGLLDRKRESYGPYLIRRLFRLLPLYLLVLLISVLMLPVSREALASAPFDGPAKADLLLAVDEAMQHLALHLAYHVPMAQGLPLPSAPPDELYMILPQAWSLSLELQFYVVAPLVLRALRPRWPAIGALVTLVVALSLVRGGTAAWLGGPKLPLFGIGIASYLLATGHHRRPLLVAVLTALSGLYLIRHGKAELLTLPLWFGAFGAAYLGTVPPLRWLRSVLSHRAAVFLGERSYSTYLIHFIPLYLAMWSLNHFGLSRSGYRLAVTLATIGATMVLSIVSFTLIERPAIALGARVARRWASAGQLRG